MSSGDSVPEVMTTVLNRSNTGLIAIAGSRQLLERSGGVGAESTVVDIRKMKYRIGDSGIFGLERLEDEQEAYAA